MPKFLKRLLGIGDDDERRRKLYEEQLPPNSFRLPRAKLLKYVPRMNPSVRRIASRRYGPLLEWDISEEQRTAPKRSFFPRAFFRQKKTHRLVLDDFGRRIAELVDGESDIAGIAAKVGLGTPYPAEQFEEAVISFLGELARRGVIMIEPER